MTSIYTNISSNKTKTIALMLSFTLFVFLISYFVYLYYGNIFIVLAGLVFALLMNIGSFWFSDKIALKASGAVFAKEDEYKELHRIVENLSITAGLPKPRVYIIPDGAPNAFATGRNPEHSAVAVTTGLLDMLDRSELEGVIAHELAHIGNRDILLMSVVVVLVGFVAVIADIAWRASLFSNSDRNKNPVFIAIWLALVILAPVISTIIQLAVSRKREFLADSSAVLLTRYPEGLASALRKISSYNAPLRRASSATAHLYISNPFGKGKSGKFVRNLFSTHPPVEERINAILNTEV